MRHNNEALVYLKLAPAGGHRRAAAGEAPEACRPLLSVLGAWQENSGGLEREEKTAIGPPARTAASRRRSFACQFSRRARDSPKLAAF